MLVESKELQISWSCRATHMIPDVHEKKMMTPLKIAELAAGAALMLTIVSCSAPVKQDNRSEPVGSSSPSSSQSQAKTVAQVSSVSRFDQETTPEEHHSIRVE